MKLLAVKKIVLLVGVLSVVMLPLCVQAQEISTKSDELSVGSETKLVPEKKEVPLENVKAVEANETAASAEAAVVAAADEKKEDSKWWHIGFGYTFSHNFNANRPELSNSFSIDPSATAPYGINFALHLGLTIGTRYPSNIVGGNDVTINNVDMDPISLVVSKSFVLDKEHTGFGIGVSLAQLVPCTSVTLRNVHHWYYAIKPGVKLFLNKKGFAFNVGASVQKNFHEYDYAKVIGVSGTAEQTAMQEWKVSISSALNYSFWKMSVGINGSWSTGWIYQSSRMETPKNSVSFGGNVSYMPLDALSLTLGVTTAGPERKYGGFKSDYVLPLSGEFTTGYFSVSYSI